MSEPVYDTFADAPLGALTTLLRDSLVARYGENIVRSVHTWPVPLGQIPASSGYPALAVWRVSGRQDEAQAYEDDIELTTFGLRFYLPPTALDRVQLRWPVLQHVWKHCIGRIRYGRDPSVPGVLLASVGFETPARAPATARFLLAPESETRFVPMIDATFTLRTSQDFEIEFELDDLLRIATDAVIADDDHPAGTLPHAFQSFEGEPLPEDP